MTDHDAWRFHGSAPIRGPGETRPAAPAPPEPGRVTAWVADRGARPPLAPVLPADDEIAPELERALANLARAARAGDRAARDALWLALGPKIDRFVAGCQRRTWDGDGPRRDGRPLDAEEIGQEAFPVFAAVLAAWPGDGPFGPFFLAMFPWRLHSVRRALVAQRRGETGGGGALWLLEDGSAAAEAAWTWLETLAGDLPPPDGAILLAHLRDREPFVVIAGRLGLTPRTVRRRWRALLVDLRRSLAGGA